MFASEFGGQRRTFTRRQALDEHEKWKREFSTREICAKGLSDPCFLAEEIYQIVVNLIGDTEVSAEATRRLDVARRRAGEPGAQKTRHAKEFSGLQVNNALVVSTSDVSRATAQRLHDFTRTNLAVESETAAQISVVGNWVARCRA